MAHSRVCVKSGIQSGVRCLSQPIYQMSRVSQYWSSVYNQVMVYYRQVIIIYYVSEHQLPHVIDASHTTPTTRVN